MPKVANNKDTHGHSFPIEPGLLVCSISFVRRIFLGIKSIGMTKVDQIEHRVCLTILRRPKHSMESFLF